MTQTKKQKTVAERVASESRYQRAAAAWVAQKTGRDVGLITEVDFYAVDGSRTDSGTYFEGEFGLVYRYRGNERRFDFSGLVTAGQFIEECVSLLEST